MRQNFATVVGVNQCSIWYLGVLTWACLINRPIQIFMILVFNRLRKFEGRTNSCKCKTIFCVLFTDSFIQSHISEISIFNICSYSPHLIFYTSSTTGQRNIYHINQTAIWLKTETSPRNTGIPNWEKFICKNPIIGFIQIEFQTKNK